MTPLLRVQGLTTIFNLPTGAVRAGDNVSLELRRGETLGLVGESGSGKSMTALSILRLVQPPGITLGGPIEFNGRRDLLELSEREMRKVRGAEMALIFQEPMTALNPVMRIGDQIGEVFDAHGHVPAAEKRRRILAALADVGLPDPELTIDSYPFRLSGGQRHRVMIACALALEPVLRRALEPGLQRASDPPRVACRPPSRRAPRSSGRWPRGSRGSRRW